jgi:hypothetical protein
VSQPPHHGVSRTALTATPAAPLIRFHDPTSQDCSTGLDSLSDDLQAEFVKPGETGQVSASEGSVRHVEVFQMSGVGTFIIGRPRPLPSDRRAHHRYTLNCDEPVWR